MNRGVGVSRGIAIGKALVYQSRVIKPTHRMITVTEVDDEKTRILRAVTRTQEYLNQILARQGDEESVARDLIEVQLEIAEDPALLNKANEYVEVSLIEAGDALLRATDDIAAQFESLEVAYYRDRAADIRDVGTRLAAQAFGVELVDLSHLNEPVIVFAEDITPSEAATMDTRNVLALVTELGSETSHTAILSKTLQIPAIVGVRPDRVRSGQNVALDGVTGELVVEPNPDEIAIFEQRQARFNEDRERVQNLRGLPAVSLDGVSVELAINIAHPHEAAAIHEVGAGGVGLFRTEFIFMDLPKAPTEEEQFYSYKTAVEQADGKPVIIRTLDAGGDKGIPYLAIPEEQNPFLGYRAIRVCLDKPDLFKDQLRAILRASAFGDVRIMFPMIGALSQLKRSLALLEECKSQLRVEGHAFDEDLKVGIMVEIPAVAAAAEIFAPHVQFFSIGTNDLCQYTLAVDRTNAKIADLYSHYNPGVLRLIKHTIDVAKQYGVKVGMCGEMAGNASAAPLLMGLGLEEFSMSPASIPYVKDKIRGLSMEQAARITETVLKMDSATAIKEYLEKKS